MWIEKTGEFVIEVLPKGKEFPLSDKQIALRKRLEARLELSRQYEKQIERVRQRIGLAAAERKFDRLCAQVCASWNGAS